MSIGTLTSVYTGTLRLRRLYARRRRARNAAAVRVETIDVVSDDRRPRPIKQKNEYFTEERNSACFILPDGRR